MDRQAHLSDFACGSAAATESKYHFDPGSGGRGRLFGRDATQ
jgi:hypothetical protein